MIIRNTYQSNLGYELYLIFHFWSTLTSLSLKRRFFVWSSLGLIEIGNALRHVTNNTFNEVFNSFRFVRVDDNTFDTPSGWRAIKYFSFRKPYLRYDDAAGSGEKSAQLLWSIARPPPRSFGTLHVIIVMATRFVVKVRTVSRPR